MTELDDAMRWQCSMCKTSITILPSVVDACGEEYCTEKMDWLKELHFNEHANEFAMEMELAL